MTLEGIARVVHEANRAYCLALGDHSQPLWQDAPDWQQQSAMIGVLGILDGEITSPRASHESWLDEKRRTGWRYGPRKDPERKEHPCMVPYEQLPEEQRAKDRLFFAIVEALGDGLA